MNFKLFSIRDVKAGVFLAPFVARSSVDATRQITAGFADPHIRDTPIGRHPEDFDLFEIGTFDDATGVVTQYGVQTHVSQISALSPTSTVPS